jgi:hypothetical protein
MMHKGKVMGVVGAIALGVGWMALRTPAATNPFPKDTIFATNSDTNDTDVLYKIGADGTAEQFATVTAGLPEGVRHWFCPIGFAPNGHLYIVSVGGNGSLWDVTDGGDRSADKAFATGLFTSVGGKVCGLAFDAAGNAYVSNSENGKQAIARVASDGKISALPVQYDRPRGLAIRKDADNKEILYIAEGGSGSILTYNLTDDKPGDKPLATGFVKVDNHQPGSVVVDPRGRVLVLWKRDPDDSNSGAVFDVTDGGDFASKDPVLDLGGAIRMDVNEMAVDSKNNLYIASDGSGEVYMSPFVDGKFGDIESFASGMGDCEAVAIAP